MTLGIMMIISAKNPVRNSMFIWFVVWSSVVHAVIMAYQAAIAADEMGHFIGDIPVLIILALLLGYSLKKLRRVLIWIPPRADGKRKFNNLRSLCLQNRERPRH